MKISDGNSSPKTKLPEVWQVEEGEMTHFFWGVSEQFPIRKPQWCKSFQLLVAFLLAVFSFFKAVTFKKSR